jgi:Cdc6-like AAA superfamily ATPase
MDSRVRSSLRFSEVEFKPYNEEQLFGILRSRAESGLVAGSWNERLLRKAATRVDEGSARVALHYLWKAAKKAENKSRKKIMLQDLEDIIAEDEQTLKISELKLSPEESLIMELLKAGELNSSDLYERFIEKTPKTKRQIRNYIELLERKGLVESESLEADGMLQPKVFRLRR